MSQTESIYIDLETYPAVDEEPLIVAAHLAGFSLGQIAQQFDRSQRSIIQVLMRHQVYKPKMTSSKKRVTKRQQVMLIEQWLNREGKLADLEKLDWPTLETLTLALREAGVHCPA